MAVSQAAPPSSRLRLSECQLFLKLVSLPASLPTIPPAASPSLLSHGDVGPAIAVGQSCRCLRCARRTSSLEGSGDRLISPGARSPGKEGNIKKKDKKRREGEEAGCFAEHLPPAAESHSPSDKEKEQKSIS